MLKDHEGILKNKNTFKDSRKTKRVAMSPVLETTDFWGTISLKETKTVFSKQSPQTIWQLIWTQMSVFVLKLKEAILNT